MGNRFFDESYERILNGQKRLYRIRFAKPCSTRGRCPERPPRRRNPDCYTGKRATTGRERGAPVRKARILGSMGGGVVDFCGRGAVRGEGIGTRGSGRRSGSDGVLDRFWHRFERLFYRDSYTGNRFFDENCERILDGQNRRYRRNGAKLCSTRGRCPERPRRRRNPDWYTGKRATTGREVGAPVRKARSSSRGWNSSCRRGRTKVLEILSRFGHR